jgi:hypothetical protein
MSTLGSIINQINQLSGYQVPTSSGYILSQSANPVGSGSVNTIINYLNGLTGYNIPSTQVQYVSGSNVAGPVVIYTPYAAGGTIPIEGILPGAIIRSEHLLRIINALNGVNVDIIIISGSFLTSGSNVLDGTLSLPFIPDDKYLVTSGGYVVGIDTPVSASYAMNVGYNYTASFTNQSTWVIDHYLKNRVVIVQAYNTNYQQIIPQTIELTNENTATITFPFPTSGFVVASVGGAIVSHVDSASYASTASYIDPKNLPFSTYQIFTGSISASVDIAPESVFLIRSASMHLFQIDNSGSVSMSGSLTVNTTGSYSNLMTVRNDGVDYLKVNGEGVPILHAFTTTPTVVLGGLYVSTSGDFFIGL